MSRCSRTLAFAAVTIVWGGLSAHAETLRCQSINGNLNCAGSSGVSCQTINGKTVCLSGHGDVVQSFGNGHADQEGMDDMPPARPRMNTMHHRLPDPSIDLDWPSPDGSANDDE
jgi:hypothetical protein